MIAPLSEESWKNRDEILRNCRICSQTMENNLADLHKSNPVVSVCSVVQFLHLNETPQCFLSPASAAILRIFILSFLNSGNFVAFSHQSAFRPRHVVILRPTLFIPVFGISESGRAFRKWIAVLINEKKKKSKKIWLVVPWARRADFTDYLESRVKTKTMMDWQRVKKGEGDKLHWIYQDSENAKDGFSAKSHHSRKFEFT